MSGAAEEEARIRDFVRILVENGANARLKGREGRPSAWSRLMKGYTRCELAMASGCPRNVAVWPGIPGHTRKLPTPFQRLYRGPTHLV